MPRPRKPLDKVKTSGSDLVNPGRFASRRGPSQPRPVGAPYPTMSAAQKRAWKEMSEDLPWLNSSHRVLLRLACMLTARIEEGDMGVAATSALSSILSKLGATPVDETRVNHASDDDEDAADEFFGCMH